MDGKDFAQKLLNDRI